MVKPLTKAWQEDIRRAVEVMRAGGIILYPTDTIWGIGCDATNEEAVKKIYALKEREDSKALICLVHNDARVQYYVRNVPNVAWDIIDCALRPTTIVYDEARNLAPNLIAEDGSIAIRITNEPFSKALCERMKHAIVSTSANISGMPSPTCFDEIDFELRNAVDYVCTSRRNERNPQSSSIIKIGKGGEVKIIRK